MKKVSCRIFLMLMVLAPMVYAQEGPFFQNGQDPKPAGKKWVKIENLSDEFDGTALDETKWKNTDPSRWLGRAPAIFKKDVATVSDGNLRLTCYQLPEPEVVNGKTWTHAGGYIGSKNAAQVGSYFEARMKGSKTFMSSTFWVINNRGDGSGCDVRVTELDIQECIGQVTTTASWAQNKYRTMSSNTHSRQAVCDNTPQGSKGNSVDLGGAAYADYHVYAAWWKSPNEILFFLDGKHVYTVEPVADFNLPMYLRMVSETYDWNPVPADGGMTGSVEDRTTFYDWVRVWKLEDVPTSVKPIDEKEFPIYPNPASGLLHVNLPAYEKVQVQVCDLQGRILLQAVQPQAAAFDLDISGLSQGNYFLEVQGNSKRQVFQFIKK